MVLTSKDGTVLDEYNRILAASKTNNQHYDNVKKRFSNIYDDTFDQEARAYIDELKLWYKGEEQ